MNYTELATAIQNFCENSEDAFVSHINDFIRGAEDKVFLAVKGSLFWKASINQTFSIGTDTIAVASGAIDVVDFYVNGEVASTGGNTLEQVDHSFLREAFPVITGSPVEGIPRYYSLTSSLAVAGSPNLALKVAPIPDAAYQYTISYYGKSTSDSITDGNTPGTNSTDVTWLSLAYPDILLYGALERAYIFLKGEPQEVARYKSIFDEQVTLLKNTVEGRIPTDDSTSMAAAQAKGI